MNQLISKREQQILHLIAHENSSKMIANELFISEHTVISHRKNLMHKLKASNTAGLMRRAFESGLLSLSRHAVMVVFLIIGMSINLKAQKEIELRTDGIVVPRTTIADITDPVEGMFFYSTDDDAYLYYDGLNWLPLGSDVSNSFDSLFIARSLQLGTENMSYGIDTSGLVIKRNADTIFSIANRIETQMNLRLANSDTTGAVLVNTTNNPSIRLFDEEQNQSVEIYSHFTNAAPERNPRIILTHHDELGDEVSSIQLNANFQNTNDSRIITDEIQIDGGSDLAELFDITDRRDMIQPGYVVSIDPDEPGKLMLSNKAYDKKVAGVLSGANGVKPGILMGQDNTIATGDDLVTLSGRTYVVVNDEGGKINVGDLITTSSIPGQAMRAKKNKKAQGAVIGKAMTPMSGKKGFVLVLVNLQ